MQDRLPVILQEERKDQNQKVPLTRNRKFKIKNKKKEIKKMS